MLRDFFLGCIKIHVLHHAANAPIYGVAMIAELARHGYDLSPGTLYPLLHHLEKQEYLARTDQVVDGRVRKYYTITDDGHAALQEAKQKIAELVQEVLEEDELQVSDSPFSSSEQHRRNSMEIPPPEPAASTNHPNPSYSPLVEVLWLFLRLDFTAFGGPAAHIAMMREEIVQKRQQVSSERFVDLIGITNLIPGSSSTELAIYLGYLRAGWPGLLIAGVCFIGPAMLIVLALAWAYVTYGALPQIGWLFYGIGLAVSF